jgi:hypothetical protein
VFESRSPAGRGLPRSASFEIGPPAALLGTLTLGWSDGRGPLSPEETLALELLSDSLAKAAVRLMAQAEADPVKVVALR